MAKVIKARSDLGINTIMDPVMVPDGFSRVCDGLDLRSGSARTWNLPAFHRDLVNSLTSFIWEYRGKWYESTLIRSYHAEYLQGREVIYYTEEGVGHTIPQKIVDGNQARLGTPRPLAPPTVTYKSMRFPTQLTAVVSGAGTVHPPGASYRIAAMVGDKLLTPSGAVTVGVTTDATVYLSWRKVDGATGYAIFGRTNNSERLLIKLGNTDVWTDDGSAQEGYETAASFDSTQSYQYVYTYYRKVGTLEDESGPSPISPVSAAGSTPIITRQVLYDGTYGFGGTQYLMSGHTLTAYSISNPYHVLPYYKMHASSNSTMWTTASAHSLTTGMKGRLTALLFKDIEYAVTIPTPLAAPTITIAALDPYPVGGTVSVGAHTYKFTAARGIDPAIAVLTALTVSPAQTTATTVVATVVGSPSSVRFDIKGLTSGTDAVIVYRDTVPIAIIDPWSIATWTDTGFTSIGTATVPASNETATRCFSLNGLNGFTPEIIMPSDIFQPSQCEITLGTPGGFAPAAGDILQFQGLVTLSALNGSCLVLAYNSGTGKATLSRFLDLSLNGVTDTGTGSMTWALGNGSYSGWRIYRVGDTSEFLRVVDLPMTEESYTDLVSTDELGITIPTAYTSNGLEVVFDKPPDDLKRMVSHYGIRFGISGNIVRWTPANQPDAWPDVYYAAFPSNPVALVPFRQVLVVLCEDGMYGLVGNTPSTLSPSGPFSNLGCIAPFSAQASNRGLLWLSRFGVCISRDGVSAQLLAPDKTSPKFFYAPSVHGGVDYPNYGQDWYIPAEQTTQFAESMRYETIDSSRYPVSQIAADIPSSGEMVDIRSVYWDDRYMLYYSGNNGHSRSCCVCVDMSREDTPITTLPVKPTSAHVTLGGDLYLLCQYMPVTTVTITSPV